MTKPVCLSSLPVTSGFVSRCPNAQVCLNCGRDLIRIISFKYKRHASLTHHFFHRFRQKKIMLILSSLERIYQALHPMVSLTYSVWLLTGFQPLYHLCQCHTIRSYQLKFRLFLPLHPLCHHCTLYTYVCWILTNEITGSC